MIVGKGRSLKLKLLDLPCDGGSSGTTGDLGRRFPDRIVLGVSGKSSSWEDAVEREGDDADDPVLLPRSNCIAPSEYWLSFFFDFDFRPRRSSPTIGERRENGENGRKEFNRDGVVVVVVVCGSCLLLLALRPIFLSEVGILSLRGLGDRLRNNGPVWSCDEEASSAFNLVVVITPARLAVLPTAPGFGLVCGGEGLGGGGGRRRGP